MIRTWTCRLYPTKLQEARFRQYLYVGRMIFNDALEQRRRHHKETGKTLSLYDQDADLTSLRAVSPIIRGVPYEVAKDALRRVDDAFCAFFRRLKARRGKPGFPRFKPAQRWNSFSIGRPAKPVRGNRIRIMGIDSLVRGRNICVPDGRIKKQRIVWRAGRWYCQFVIDDGQASPPLVPVVNAIGVDVGLREFATLSDGSTVENPRFGTAMARRLHRAQRAFARKRMGSNNRRKALGILQRVYARISDLRWNFTHQLSTSLVSKYQLIAVEDLTIAGMARNRRLRQSILDAAWGQFIWQLHYKAEWAGVQCVEVNPAGTSQLCSKCGNVVAKDLKQRVHRCPACGLVLDRDHNAAINILERARADRAMGETPVDRKALAVTPTVTTKPCRVEAGSLN